MTVLISFLHMMKKTLLVSFGLICILYPLSTQAAGGSESSTWGWIETVGRWFNLLILFGLIYYFTRVPMKRLFVDRRLNIQREIQEARKAQKLAEEKLTAIEERMSNIDQELAGIRRETEREAELERCQVSEQAEREAEKILVAVRQEIDGLSSSAEQRLREYVAHLSVQLAEEQIRQDMENSDENRVINRFLVKLNESCGE